MKCHGPDTVGHRRIAGVSLPTAAHFFTSCTLLHKPNVGSVKKACGTPFCIGAVKGCRSEWKLGYFAAGTYALNRHSILGNRPGQIKINRDRVAYPFLAVLRTRESPTSTPAEVAVRSSVGDPTSNLHALQENSSE